MTTYSYDAIFVSFDNNDNVSEFRLTDIALVTGPGGDTLTYDFVGTPRDDGLRPILDTKGLTYGLMSDGNPLGDDAIPYIARLTWGAGNVSFILIVETNDGEYIVQLGGDPINLRTAQEFAIFNDTQITGISNVTGGPFAPGRAIDLTTIPTVQISEDDLIFTNPSGGNVNGGPGEDTIIGGNGDDVINPGANPNGGDDIIFAGLGNDRIILSDVTNPGHYISIAHSDLSSGIVAFVDGTANTARVEKVQGTTTIIDINTPMTNDGMLFGGTVADDVFNITPVNGGFFSLRASEGDDTVNIGDSAGRIRLDYSNSPGPIVADLANGTISDGFGGIDTITFGTARVELRGTSQADIITGSSANERFILEGGDDTLDGGGGIDRIRFDRTGVEGLVVDLEAGTATGTWRGTAFNSTISNVEEILGSQSDDLIMGSNNGDETLEGNGGDDTIGGGGGDDYVDGGEGSDTALLGVDLGDVISATENPNGTLTVVTAQGSDTFENIEFYDLNGTIVTATALLNGPFSTTPSTGDDIITGDETDDRVDAGDGNDTVNGGLGDDGLKGRGGDDLLVGGPGNDRLPGEGGNDTLLGNDGNDRLGGGFGNDSMVGGAGDDGGGAGPGNDTIYGNEGNDRFNGGYGDDYIDMGAGNDTTGGSYDNDTMFGGTGDDLMGGGWGDDIMNGGDGNDTLNGGYGDDTLTGGAGEDLFIFNNLSGGGTTVITDFEDGIDTIRVTGLRNPADPVARLNITDITYEGSLAVEMTYGKHTIIVLDARESDFTTDDFLFV